MEDNVVVSRDGHTIGPVDLYKYEKITVLDRWFIKHHGIGEPHQAIVYRCNGCHRILTHRHIKNGPCICGVNRLSTYRPTYLQLLRLYVLPWSFYWGRLLTKAQREELSRGPRD